MPDALRHKITIPGMVLPWNLTSRELQQQTTKFWGVVGESRINGLTAGRTLDIPVLVYDAGKYNTRARLSRFLDEDVSRDLVGQVSTLTVVSDAGHSPFNDTSFEGCIILDGPKIDEAGTLGGGAWALCRFLFRQHA